MPLHTGSTMGGTTRMTRKAAPRISSYPIQTSTIRLFSTTNSVRECGNSEATDRSEEISVSEHYHQKIKKAKSAELAIGILAEMRRKGISPNLFHYSTVISRSAPKQALQLLEEIKEVGLHPEVFNYTSAISALGKGGQWQKAQIGIASCKERV